MSKPNYIRVALEGGSDVSGRALARKLRVRAIAAAECDDCVEIDFAGVECASDSFLDELIGVLIAQRGKSWFRAHVALKNLVGHIRLDLLNVVRARLSEHEEESRLSSPAQA